MSNLVSFENIKKYIQATKCNKDSDSRSNKMLKDVEEFEKCEADIDYIIDFLHNQPNIPKTVVDLLDESIEKKVVLASKIVSESKVTAPEFEAKEIKHEEVYI
ncbi:MAG: hypothetical protein FWF46_03430 [Oscillospiraceae bacterium]|nr:hypothetical protein [Oscillospiraceae bacterium]